MSTWGERLRAALTEDRTMRENTRGGGAKPGVNPEQLAAFGAEFGGYLVPGTGVVDAGGMYPALSDPNQARYAGLLSNLSEGEYGTAAAQGLGVLGDAATYGGGILAATGAGAPVGGLLVGLGTVAKLPRAVGKGVKAAKAVGVVKALASSGHTRTTTAAKCAASPAVTSYRVRVRKPRTRQ